jgi:hypothetical protein
MASIVHAQNNVVSLEISELDLPLLRRLIEENWGKPKTVRYPTSENHRFGGEEFTFQSEWSDPCLITSTLKGSEMLMQLRDQLNSRK